MKIAIIGIRGVPANYSGLEDCAEQVGIRLVQRGHEVTVYCRKGFYNDSAREYKGIRRIMLPSLKTKNTDTYSHSLLSMLHVLSQRPDVILAFNPGIASLCVIPKLLSYPVALNPDGYDWRRAKWNWFGRFFLGASAWMSPKIVDQMIMDAVSVKDYYNSAFRCKPPAIYIPNGGFVEPPEQTDVPDTASDARSGAEADEILRQYGLERQKYVMFLSRIEPENSCREIVEAFQGVKTDKKLFFGGGSPYRSPYVQSLHQTDDPRILFPGAIYDRKHVKVLHHHCYFLIHGNQQGGTSVGLVKAMGLGTCVLTPNTPDNAYAVQDAGCLYEVDSALRRTHNVDDLRGKMQMLIDNVDIVREKRAKGIERAKEEYSWDAIADQYEEALMRLVKNGRRNRRSNRRARNGSTEHK